MNTKDREKYLAVKAERDLLRRRLSTARDAQLLLLMENLEQRETIETLRASLKAATREQHDPTESDRTS